MIEPHKYMDIEYSILNIGGIILSILKNRVYITYDELLDDVTLRYGEKSKTVFIPSLSFLFLLGKIDYERDTDTLKLI